MQVVNVRRMLSLPAMLEHPIIPPSRLTAGMQLNDGGDVTVYTATYRKSDDLPLVSVRPQAPLSLQQHIMYAANACKLTVGAICLLLTVLQHVHSLPGLFVVAESV